MESTRFLRRIDLPGVELLEVIDSQRPWRRFSSAFEVMVPGSWSGEIRYRGVRHRVGPGMLFCPGPGDCFEIPRAHAPGSFQVLLLAPDPLRKRLLDHGLAPESLHFHRVFSTLSAELSAALRQLLDDMRIESSTLKLQSSLAVLEPALVTHLARERHEPCVPASASAATRVHELIHSDVEGKLDLDALSRETGLSRFQVVRTFKRSYGLPPHAYQLCVRIAEAQRLLSLGYAPAAVASALRFVDQSHLTRHFKRTLGVTPSAYARASRNCRSDRWLPAQGA